MTDPTEKINYALSLVDGATPGPFHWYYHPSDSPHVPDESGLISDSGGGIILSDDAGYWPEPGSPDGHLIALGSSLIPAALRLALAADDARDYLNLTIGGCDRDCDCVIHPLDMALGTDSDPAKILRAAIAREEERQEIIDGLVEAGRGSIDRPTRAALARYDAMKEDDRGA